jgi:hypothetical protein
MSARGLVTQMRDGGGPPPVGPRLRVTDVLLVAIVVVALGAAGYFGVGLLLRGASIPPSPIQVATISALHPGAVWTRADDDRCQARARAAASAGYEAGYQVPPEGQGSMPPNPAVTEGYAGLSTMLECHLTTKPGRLCDPDEKSKIVAEVNGYLGRTDIVMAAMVVEGAPMKVMGQLMGGEPEGGSGIYDLEHESTVKFMQAWQTKIATALRKLARDGLIAPADFAGFMEGVPEPVKRLFGSAVAERKVCS